MIRRLLWGLAVLMGLTACAAAPLTVTPQATLPIDSVRPTFTFFFTDN